MQAIAPWLVLLAFSALTWWVTPRRVNAAQFFDGRTDSGRPPGVLMVAMGTVWALQGLDLAFRVGPMVGDRHWTLYGAILALVGIAQAVWSNTRQTRG